MTSMSIHRNIGIEDVDPSKWIGLIQSHRAALEHFAFRWNHLKVSKMLQSQKHRASFARKTAHTFAHDALEHESAQVDKASPFKNALTL
jgi:hypothetical protein